MPSVQLVVDGARVCCRYLGDGMTEEEVDDMFAAMAANSKTVKGHTTQGELLAAGQFDVALSLYSQTVERAQSKGAPLPYGVEQRAEISAAYDELLRTGTQVG